MSTIIRHWTAFVLHISLRKCQAPSSFLVGAITVGVTNTLTPFKIGWAGNRVWLLSNCRYGQKNFLDCSY